MAELDTSPAEMLYGQMPTLPGDLLTNDSQSLVELLQNLRTNAAKPPIPTSHHRKITPYFPEEAKNATHVYTKIGKPAQLGPSYEGPYRIDERIGKSTLKIHVGNWANGNARHELVPMEKQKRGRPALNANAPVFKPS